MPPFPPYKEMPKLSNELSQRYDSREVVVYAIINSEGRFEQLAVKENSRVGTERANSSGIKKWTFRPA